MLTNKIRYVPLGDSYTICEGAQHNESWPALLTKHLCNVGFNFELLINPSVTGWTSQNLIEKELPVFDASNPNFATLLIGVNDWVQKVSVEKFQSNLAYIIDRMLEKLLEKNRLLLITIPDFSVTPNGPKYSGGRNITEGIKEFNTIISTEAKRYGLRVADIFPTSREMINKPDHVSADGLHPSAKEYALWEEIIYKEVFCMIR